MTKLTSLPIILLTLANITPALTVFIPNFLNYTNSTNITYHIPPHPAPSPSGTLPSNISTLQTPDKNDLVWVPPSSPTFYRGNRLYEDEVCGASSFTGITRATSPLTQDCLDLADDAAKERYVWYAKGFVDNTTILGIRSHGTCTFGIKPPYADALPRIMTGWYVGGVDVAEVVRTAVRDYDVAGQVGASGMMYCWANRQNHVDVQWAIYGASEQAEAGYFWAPPVPANSGAGKGGIVSTGVIIGVLVFWLLLFWNIVN
ncbi:putative necrosis-inducing factor-domain-containing protein [Colletotrichum godetiae]|uniref:Necrosis-inducing factor-domain-containing protein n=1 Tax=Colletotrichum godetiae TaxID=1209918 RepID=A0AAJ0ERT2_9PEZI|nr:putative necrosis-inducing factor-domain-containing protein [Colletotrichum godetiae]KAK1658849.1 putative necrosis-inducing factor-domain-containing protein [Colletotrichum godetiae]